MLEGENRFASERNVFLCEIQSQNRAPDSSSAVSDQQSVGSSPSHESWHLKAVDTTGNYSKKLLE